jgi:hypothetical protein
MSFPPPLMAAATPPATAAGVVLARTEIRRRGIRRTPFDRDQLANRRPRPVRRLAGFGADRRWSRERRPPPRTASASRAVVGARDRPDRRVIRARAVRAPAKSQQRRLQPWQMSGPPASLLRPGSRSSTCQLPINQLVPVVHRRPSCPRHNSDLFFGRKAQVACIVDRTRARVRARVRWCRRPAGRPSAAGSGARGGSRCKARGASRLRQPFPITSRRRTTCGRDARPQLESCGGIYSSVRVRFTEARQRRQAVDLPAPACACGTSRAVLCDRCGVTAYGTVQPVSQRRRRARWRWGQNAGPRTGTAGDDG